ncbi:cuticle protein 16.8-like [Ornithodoros turicata]|uniref:cuticle protein 16.8-like n=1 Tax=Ornithodoros turicata TaxID=34597 RepID=UPI003138BA3B
MKVLRDLCQSIARGERFISQHRQGTVSHLCRRSRRIYYRYDNSVEMKVAATTVMTFLFGMVSRSVAFPGAEELAARMNQILPPEEIQSAEDTPVSVPAPRRPYSFSYAATDPQDGSSHSRSETSDVTGRVVGFYTIRTADGRSRRVNYVADERGFRAEVVTNEPGTTSHNPANVIFRSSAHQPFPSRQHTASGATLATASSYVPVARALPSERTIVVPVGHRAIFVPIEAVTPDGRPSTD